MLNSKTDSALTIGSVQFVKMAADTVAAPHLSLNVRYKRNVKENSGEEEENQVEILEDEEHHAELKPQRASKSEMMSVVKGKFISVSVRLYLN